MLSRQERHQSGVNHAEAHPAGHGPTVTPEAWAMGSGMKLVSLTVENDRMSKRDGRLRALDAVMTAARLRR